MARPETAQSTAKCDLERKVALPEGRRLTDDRARPSVGNAGLPGKGSVREGSPWGPRGCAEFWDSPCPIRSPHRLSPPSPKAFPLQCDVSQCHVFHVGSCPELSERPSPQALGSTCSEGCGELLASSSQSPAEGAPRRPGLSLSRRLLPCSLS